MDPNLTLAHITHNTAVVLLHQGIAYPSSEWQSTPIKLPSQSSAETCLAAAIEVSTIAQQFLRNSMFLANHQFAFCLFVCGRMLLAHSSYFRIPLAPSFDSLIESLREVSKRWNGLALPLSSSVRSGDLASKFASRLSEARDLGPTTFDIRQAAYSDDSRGGLGRRRERLQLRQQGLSRSFSQESFPPDDFQTSTIWNGGDATLTSYTDASPESITLAFPPLPQAFQAPSGSHAHITTPALPMNGMYGFPDIAPAAMGSTGMSEDGQQYQGFEDISAYLDGSFLPDQRISMYSQPENSRE